MLFTRCPDCRTTFRVTVEILKKADGQVRCGRCAAVFNGFGELIEREASSAEPAPDEPAARESEAGSTAGEVDPGARLEPSHPGWPEASVRLEGAVTQPETAGDAAPAETTTAAPPAAKPDAERAADDAATVPAPETAADAAPAEATETVPAPETAADSAPAEATETVPAPETAADSAPAETTAAAPPAAKPDAEQAADAAATVPAPETAAETAPAEATTAVPPAAAGSTRAPPVEAITADEVDKVLESLPAEPAGLWTGDAGATRNRAVAWRFAAGLAALTLAAQLGHHYRADLARHWLIGPAVRAAYQRLGMSVEPRWVPEDYEVMSWETKAASNPGAPDSLLFSASIRNRTNQPIAYPIVHLKLTNRWQDSVGARYFYPAEYVAAGWRSDATMPPNGIVEARLELVDPGAEAYGFEVDLCVELAADQFSCKADSIFQKSR
jgi:predicted Zn finger-like uncharacterized protein